MKCQKLFTRSLFYPGITKSDHIDPRDHIFIQANLFNNIHNPWNQDQKVNAGYRCVGFVGNLHKANISFCYTSVDINNECYVITYVYVCENSSGFSINKNSLFDEEDELQHIIHQLKLWSQ